MLEKKPVFFELYFDGELKDANLMISCGGEWFYKKPGVSVIDMNSAFFDREFEGGQIFLSFFAPPASGENDPGQGEGWQTDYYYTMKSLPRLRIRYKAILE